MSECVFLVNIQVATRDSSGTSRNAQRRLVATIRRFQSGAPAAKRQQSSFLLALSRPSAPAPRHRVEVVLAGQHKARGFGAADYGLSSTRRIDQVRHACLLCQAVPPYLGRGAASVGKRVEPPPRRRVPLEANRPCHCRLRRRCHRGKIVMGCGPPRSACLIAVVRSSSAASMPVPPTDAATPRDCHAPRAGTRRRRARPT